jgi:putative DNA methylase
MTYKKKLIEVALPLEDINREAAREKSIRHGHPSTLHLWWARRPLAACRAVLFASLVDDPSECVAELMADASKRRAAEKALAAQRKLWEARKTLFDKAQAAKISAPEPGPEPKLGEVIVETERERLFDIIRELVKWENSNDDRTLNKARAEILRSTGGNPPPVCDPFCGGGSIPLEAQRLGLEAHASDLNPVPVLINKALIEIPPRFAGKPPVNPESRKKLSASGSWKGAAGLAEDIRYYGQWMRDEAEKRIGHLYPKVAVVQESDGKFRHATPEEKQSQNSRTQDVTVIAWLWARTVASPNPAVKGAQVPLTRSFWLSMKPGKRTWVDPVVDEGGLTYQFEIRSGDGEPRSGMVNRNGGVCLLTGSPIPLDYIRAEGKAGRLGARLMAVVGEGKGTRIYLPPTEEQESIAKNSRPHGVPDTDMPKDALGFRVQNYGMTKHRHLFTQRQLAAMTTFCDLVGETREQALKDSHGDRALADAVATYLALGIGRCADFWNTLATWSWQPKNELVGHAFGRQALPITWDFGEINPFSDSGGNFSGNLEFTVKALARTPACGSGIVRQMNAEAVGGKSYCFSTDPPYYDNVPYADLSDFFYIWLRKCLLPVYPELLGTVLVPKAEELIAEPFRHGGKDKARLFFEQGMGRVFERMRASSDPRFPATIYYAFKQTEDDEDNGESVEDSSGSRASTGWETFLQGLADAGWQIDGTWPMRTERSGRLRDNASNALASSIILVCRPRPTDAGVTSRRDFLAALKRELPEALRNLQKGNIAPVDLAQAAIGPGMAVFSRYARVLETDGSPMGVRTALSLINQSLDEVLAEQEGEFDADTRWALAWFDQYGFTEGAYGQAETLSTAKNTSVSGMVEAGILAAKGGKVRLLKKEELPADWDPAEDSRLTIWESTHQLIRALDQGEQAAAELLRKLGAVAEIARDLSYRLYTVCERRKWSQDAIGYNALVLAWPDLTRLAQEQKAAGPSQGELI